MKRLTTQITALAITLVGLSSVVNAQEAPKPTPVIVTVAQEQYFTDTVEALGTLRANESVTLTSTVTELVTRVNFDDNQAVSQGDIIIEMDAVEEQAELQEQEYFLSEAQRQVSRLEPLVKKGAASESTLDEKRREELSAQARINAINSRIDQRIIRAPYDGVLGLRNISVGALAQPGVKLATIDDIRVMKLDFSVPELFLSTLTLGVEVRAISEAFPHRIFSGSISGIDSRIDPVTRAIQARALIENPEGILKPGLLMKVELQKNPRHTIAIPEETLITEGDKHFVLVVEEQDGKMIASRRNVILGTRRFGEVEILSGLEVGTQVVTHGTIRVRPGEEVSIIATERNNETLIELLNQQSPITPDEDTL